MHQVKLSDMTNVGIKLIQINLLDESKLILATIYMGQRVFINGLEMFLTSWWHMTIISTIACGWRPILVRQWGYSMISILPKNTWVIISSRN